MTVILQDLEQGTPEWHAARLGIPTASCFSKIITSRGKPSTSAKAYLFDLLADFTAGEPQNNFVSNAMMNGILMEPVARTEYKLLMDVDVDEVGFGYLDDAKTLGASPDGLVGDRGMLEIKCPKLARHLGYKFGKECPAKYYTQVQGQLWVFERDWCDFMSYHEMDEPFIVRVPRNDPFIDGMSEAVQVFSERLEQMKQENAK